MKILLISVVSSLLLSGCNVATIEASKTFPSEGKVYNPHPSRYERHQDGVYNQPKYLPPLPQLPSGSHTGVYGSSCYYKTVPVRSGNHIVGHKRIRVCT